MALESWESRAWEDQGVGILVQHFGVDCVVRVPDDGGGDAGLDANTTTGMGYQCYAPSRALRYALGYFVAANYPRSAGAAGPWTPARGEVCRRDRGMGGGSDLPRMVW